MCRKANGAFAEGRLFCFPSPMAPDDRRLSFRGLYTTKIGRIPAHEIETVVRDGLTNLLVSPDRLMDALGDASPPQKQTMRSGGLALCTGIFDRFPHPGLTGFGRFCTGSCWRMESCGSGSRGPVCAK
jgi:hypothetical protein